MADFHWPPADKRQLLGKRISRLDGPWKATGTATYTYDVHREGMLFGRMALSPHAHAKIVSIDTSAAEKMPGVKAVDIIVDPGKEVLWAGQEIVSLAAETDDQARDAVRAIHIEYQVLPYLVSDVAPSQAPEGFIQKLNEQTDSDPDSAFQQSDVTHEGEYGTAVITHCCLESHGQVCEWQGDQLTVWASTQNVSGIPGELATGLNVPAANIRVITPVMGGGFGSKFGADTWGKSCAQLARKANRPVKMMLDRDHELNGAGMRPSIYAKVKVAAKRDGTLTAWQSESWGTSGPGGGNSAQLPYIFQIPYRRQHTAVHTNVGPARAWRAPNHPQWCLVTMGALDDLSAKLNMDPLDFFRKNIAKTGARSQNYSEELEIAAQLMDWKKKWQPRGKSA
ncbi:MAG TPA: molybdopterin cofactor-binding domain-containing protein, partial [Candidatus Acidoferrales bacterium]|nr:molybdopterin cofactor-binding domain-containing protein [Candidatus Acidoferrales bacterium]